MFPTNAPEALLKPSEGWAVSWLPGRTLTRNQAITAMTLAERVTQGATGPDHKDWPFIQRWAEELDLSATTAVNKITDTERQRR